MEAGGCQDGKLIPGRKQEAAALGIVGSSSCLKHMSPSPGAPGGGRGSSRRPPGRPDDLAVAARESMVPCGRRCKEKSYRDNTTPNRLISLSAPARNRLAIASMFMSVDATKNGFFLLSLSRSLAAGTTVGVFDLSCSGSATLAAGSSCAEQACSRSWSLSSSWSARCACLLLHAGTTGSATADWGGDGGLDSAGHANHTPPVCLSVSCVC